MARPASPQALARFCSSPPRNSAARSHSRLALRFAFIAWHERATDFTLFPQKVKNLPPVRLLGVFHGFTQTKASEVYTKGMERWRLAKDAMTKREELD